MNLYSRPDRIASTKAPCLRSGAGPVAVIDDDLRYIRMLERTLGLDDIAVVAITTLDPDEAVRIIEAGHCQAALVDLFMYGEALGFSLVERLRANPGTRDLVIFISSGARRELGRNVDFLRRNNCGVLLKPFDPSMLMARDESPPVRIPQSALAPNAIAGLA